MKRTLALGGVAAGLLAAAAVAAPAANAAGDTSSTPLANTNLAAQQVAAFWYGEAKANLINATPYNVETTIPAKHVSTGGPSADSKPGTVPAIGDEKKSTSKSKNVNLPKTTGKVFFIGADHKPHWCSATSVQSQYHNLVATAGHCVYDTESNKATLDKWVFIPGYYQGKTPWGIYVGKQAFTHYDFDVYEDGDRDYAFVTVYNGVLPTGDTVTTKPAGPYETKAEAEAALAKFKADKTNGHSRLWIKPYVDWAHKVVVGTPGSYKFAASVAQLAVDPSTINSARTTLETQAKAHTSDSTFSDNTWGVKVTKVTTGTDGWNSTDATKQTEFIYTVGADKYKATFWGNFDVDYKIYGKVHWINLKDVGRLGDNVGGQGLAYNQKIGQPVFVFGYPSGSHPDGNHAFSGKTLKWSYGKTFAATAPAIKGDELVGVKSSFTGEGSIGSSWLLKYNNSRRLGYLNGVTIGVSDSDKNNRIDTSVSPYFDGELYGVYSAAKNLWSGKIV
ncbi:serine protease [Microbispora sp. NPDC049125]|uniref:trypsin-like serine peptidase n=1 Tax=Microbispora sp. NPDC049125 TaxID=3154929 RepID=UPI00346543D0